MANVRIKDLSTTASTTASDDFFGVDGATNGTRKLSAYSPTFGGNLTVSGAEINVGTTDGADNKTLQISGGGAGGGDSRGGSIYISGNESASTGKVRIISGNVSGATITLEPRGNAAALTISDTGNTTLAGNLTVSGTGTSSVAGSLSIGTTSPGDKLHVQGAAFITDGSNAGVRIGGAASYGWLSAYDQNVSADKPLVLQTGGGNVLVGTTTDGGQKLQVNGTAAISGALSIGNTVQTAVAVASTHKVTISIGGSTYYLLATNV